MIGVHPVLVRRAIELPSTFRLQQFAIGACRAGPPCPAAGETLDSSHRPPPPSVRP